MCLMRMVSEVAPAADLTEYLELHAAINAHSLDEKESYYRVMVPITVLSPVLSKTGPLVRWVK